MNKRLQFYIDGKWVDPVSPKTLDVINPATEEPIGQISLGSKADVDKAVKAARRAFETFSQTTKEERLALLTKVLEVYQRRYGEFVETISLEMGAPVWLSKAAQAATGVAHLNQTIKILKDFEFTKTQGTTGIVYEPVGVVGMITPWNWPVNQIMCKAAPALAAGCTMVLKPSEIAPLNAMLIADVFHEAGVPAGVFNLVNGDGPSVGEAMSSHPGIDMMSFTGSTRAGVAVAKAAADTVKRVTQELGGKSANIILEDADMKKAVSGGVMGCFGNSGQSCNAPTRMFVPRKKQDEAIAIAKATAESVKVADPFSEGMVMGPVVSEAQYNKIQGLIKKGIDEGATLVTGGLGRPEGLNRGYFVRPTVFANVTNDMTIAREEIFGPVLSILPYDTEEEAIKQANDTPYGLSGYVQSGSVEHARKVASKLRTGNVHLNGAGPDFNAPFGGYKMSGTGREWGEHGFKEFLEVKAVLGYQAA
ncbi:MAG: aldehyde dehydrogenase family protein [Alphaproteobacteria bacterium]|jgi:aldehyde dehydrogenase (NAD+)|nr:aldehyde dehydrogenase family protein [Alphaproteobacteria bacterium]